MKYHFARNDTRPEHTKKKPEAPLPVGQEEVEARLRDMLPEKVFGKISTSSHALLVCEDFIKAQAAVHATQRAHVSERVAAKDALSVAKEALDAMRIDREIGIAEYSAKLLPALREIAKGRGAGMGV